MNHVRYNSTGMIRASILQLVDIGVEDAVYESNAWALVRVLIG